MTVLDSGFYALDSEFQSTGSGIPPSKIPRFRIPDLDSLAWREPWASGKSTAFNDCHFLLEDEDELLESIAKSSALLQDG